MEVSARPGARTVTVALTCGGLGVPPPSHLTRKSDGAHRRRRRVQGDWRIMVLFNKTNGLLSTMYRKGAYKRKCISSCNDSEVYVSKSHICFSLDLKQGISLVLAFCAWISSIQSNAHAHSLSVVPHPVLRPLLLELSSTKRFFLRLRGGQDEEDSLQDTDSNISDIDDQNWDYGKFGMRAPPTADELNLNPEYTGKKGELDYLVRDVYIGRWGWTALHRAAVQGDVETLKKMVDMGGDVNAETQNGWTPLHEAASWGREQAVELLLANGANASATNKNGWTALHFAAGVGNARIVEMLLAAGVDRDYRDNFGDTALNKALRCARVKFPVLPMGVDVETSPEERRSHYIAAATLLAPNNTDLEEVEVTNDRFNVYAPILPGRKRAYHVDGLDSDENLDSTRQTIDAAGNPKMEWMTHNETDFVTDDEARREDAEAFNSTELDNMIAFMRSQESKAPASISMDGVQDTEVEDMISRWKDDEWEQRINSVVIK